MDLKKISIGCVILFCIGCMSGCVNQGTTTEKTFENIVFESDVVELDRAYLNFMRDDGASDARSVEAKYSLHNLQDREVTVQVYVFFYDTYDRELYSDGPYMINLPQDYAESGVNTVPYKGNNVRSVESVKITAYERN